MSPSYVAAEIDRPAAAGQLAELRDLVLAERLRREEEQRPRRRIVGDRLEDGQRVAQRLARCGRRDDDDVVAGADGLDRLRLVGVQPVDAACGEAGPDPRVQPVRGIAPDSASRAGMTA